MENIDFSDRQRIVIKVGTESITDVDCISETAISRIAGGVVELMKLNKYVVLVSSGAIAAGRRKIKEYSKSETLLDKKRLAGIGQPYLMEAYNAVFDKYNINTAQILVTNDDFYSKERLAELKEAIYYHFEKGDMPILNENDPIATEEIKVGDNDKLAACVARDIDMELLVMLTIKDGLYKNGKVVHYATSFKREDYDNLDMSKEGRGGIESKLDAAKRCYGHKIPCIVSNISYRIEDILSGNAPRTVFTKLK